MNIALAFHNGDKDQAVRWLDWCAEIDMEPKHDLYIMPAKDCAVGYLFDSKASFHKAFRSVTHVQDALGVKSEWSASNSPVRDASGPNSTIRQFAWHFYGIKKGPWMFMEPDAIPLCPDWLDRIESEYKASGKRFMGAVVRVPGVPVHSTGIMVLPENSTNIQGIMVPCLSREHKNCEIAFDVACAREVLADHHETKLIQHVFRGPVFESQEQFDSGVSSEAVLFHTDKTGSLLPFLRQKLGGSLNGKTSVSNTAVSGSTPDRPVQPEATPSNKIVYTYYDLVENMDRSEQEWLLSRWNQAWLREGWITIVLSEKDASTHPYYRALVEKYEQLPSVNPAKYELACYLRWVAMVQKGGGLLVDYDVMPYDFRPDHIPEHTGKFPLILADKNPCPCAVNGTAEQFNAAAFEFANKAFREVGMEHGKPHISDQQCVQKWNWTAVDICYQYGREGWEGARLVHYSHGSCGGRKRRDIIPVAEEIKAGFTKEPEATKALMDAMPDEAKTGAAFIRSRLQEIADYVSEKPSRKQKFHAELRALGLLGQPKHRIKRKKTLI